MPGSSRAWRERRHKSKQQRVNSIHNGDAHLKIPGECAEEAGCAAETSLIANPGSGAQQRQADEKLLEEPDCRLILFSICR
jgi:hypothetical protein